MKKFSFLIFMLLFQSYAIAKASTFDLSYGLEINEFVMFANEEYGLKNGMNVTGFFQSQNEFLNGTRQPNVFNSSSIMNFSVGAVSNLSTVRGFFIVTGFDAPINEEKYLIVKILVHFVWLVNGTFVIYPSFNFTVPSDFENENGECIGYSDNIGGCEVAFSFPYWNVTASFRKSLTMRPTPSSWNPFFLVVAIPVILVILLVKIINSYDKKF